MTQIRRYLRVRSYLAIAILVASAMAAFVVSSEGQRSLAEHSGHSQIIGRIMVSTSEMALAFDKIASADSQQSSNVAEGVLRRNARDGAVVLAEIIEHLQTGHFSSGPRRILEQETLNPVSEFKQVLRLANLAGDPTTPFKRKRRAGALGLELSERLLPVFMELYNLEVSDTEVAAQSQKLYARIALLLGVIGVAVTLFFVVRPMERFVAQSHADLLNSQRRAEWAQKLAEDNQAKAEAASRAKSAFLATMSHEIRTPLNGVMGLSEYLAESEPDAERRHMLELVVSSGNSLLRIINDVLDLSKIEAGKSDLVLETFDARDLCEEVIELFSAQAHRKGIELKLHVAAPEGRWMCQGYEKQVRQILLNLVNNALKFTERGAVDVTLSRNAVADIQGELSISVSDSGIGIAPEAQSRIFEQFSQADGSTTTRFGGTGLGLAIAKKLADQIGGSIALDSVVGQGSTFTLRCPVMCRNHIPAKSSDTDRMVRFKGTVLVADDNKVNLLVASKMLTSLGLQVETAADGLEAVAAFKQGQFDLVLMDVRMPNMDGLDATRAICEYQKDLDRPKVPVIGLSANAMNDHKVEGLAAGMDGYLSKPLKKSALIQELEKHGAICGDTPSEDNVKCAS